MYQNSNFKPQVVNPDNPEQGYLTLYGGPKKTFFWFWYGKQLFLVPFGHISCHRKFEVPVIILIVCVVAQDLFQLITELQKNIFLNFFIFFISKNPKKITDFNGI